MWDYSKHKDFYVLYLYNYCSGKVQDSKFLVDFCSKPSHLLFDLMPFWKSWGVSVNKGSVHFYWLDNGPKMLYVSYILAIGFEVSELLAAILVWFWKRERGTVVLFTLSTVCVLFGLLSTLGRPPSCQR